MNNNHQDPDLVSIIGSLDSNSVTFEPLLTIWQLSLFLNVSRATAYQLVRWRDIPSFKIGNAIRIRPAAVREYIARLESQNSYGGWYP